MQQFENITRTDCLSVHLFNSSIKLKRHTGRSILYPLQRQNNTRMQAGRQRIPVIQLQEVESEILLTAMHIFADVMTYVAQTERVMVTDSCKCHDMSCHGKLGVKPGTEISDHPDVILVTHPPVHLLGSRTKRFQTYRRLLAGEDENFDKIIKITVIMTEKCCQIIERIKLWSAVLKAEQGRIKIIMSRWSCNF
jgi:hypothetical protein